MLIGEGNEMENNDLAQSQKHGESAEYRIRMARLPYTDQRFTKWTTVNGGR